MPLAPNQHSGNIYQINIHNNVVFVRKQQLENIDRLQTIETIGFPFLVIFAALFWRAKDQAKRA